MSVTCDKCKKIIEDKAYIITKAFIIVNDDAETPSLVYSADNRKYYQEELTFHDSCYIQTLIDYGKTNLLQP